MYDYCEYMVALYCKLLVNMDRIHVRHANHDVRLDQYCGFYSYVHLVPVLVPLIISEVFTS